MSELDNIETNLFASLRPSKQKTSNKEIIKDSTIPTKRLFDINDEDLLDLLSDREDDIGKQKGTVSNQEYDGSKDKDIQDEDQIKDDLGKVKNSQQIKNEETVKSEETDIQFGSYMPSYGTPQTRKPLKTPRRNSSSLHTSVNNEIKFVRFTESTPTSTNEATTPVRRQSSVLLVSDIHLSSTSTPLYTSTTISSTIVPLTTISSTNVPISTIVPSTTIPSTNVPISTMVPSTTTPSTNVPISTIVPSTTIPSTNVPISTMVPSTTIPSTNVPISTIVPSNTIPSTNAPISTIVPSTTIPSTTTLSTKVPLTTEPLTSTSVPLSSITMENSTTQEVKHLKSVCQDLKEQLRQTHQLLEQESKQKQELNQQLEEMKLKIHQMKSENNEMSLSLELNKKHLKNEIQRLESMSQLKIKELENKLTMKEESMKRELDNIIQHHQEKIEHIKRDNDNIVSHFRGLLEQTNKREELKKIQEIHHKTIQTIQETHNEEMESMKRRYEEQLSSITNTLSHTSDLSNLSQQVQESAKQITEIQSQVGITHNTQLETREQLLKARENHIENVSHRVIEQEKLTENERQWLHSLVTKMEIHLTCKEKELQQEQWKIQQIKTHLETEEKTLQEEKVRFIDWIEQQKDILQKSKEQFLTEQQTLLTQYYTKHHNIATLHVELKETKQRQQQFEVELNCERFKLEEERKALSIEQAKVNKDKEEVSKDQHKLMQEREALVMLEQQLRCQTVQVNKTSQIAQEVYIEGQEALKTAQKLQEDVKYKMIILRKEQESLLQDNQLMNDQYDTPLKTNTSHEENTLSPWQPCDQTDILMKLEMSQSVRDIMNDSRKDGVAIEEEIKFLNKVKYRKC